MSQGQQLTDFIQHGKLDLKGLAQNAINNSEFVKENQTLAQALEHFNSVSENVDILQKGLDANLADALNPHELQDVIETVQNSFSGGRNAVEDALDFIHDKHLPGDIMSILYHSTLNWTASRRLPTR